jgi:hypothetical protein
MRLREVVLCALAVCLVSTTAAGAATKVKPKPPICNMIVDDAGDGASSVGGPVVKSDALDIRGGDVATGAKTLVGVLRLTRTSTNNDYVTMTGVSWGLTFYIRSNPYTFTRRRNSGVPESYVDTFSGGSDKLTTTVTPTEIRWTIPRSVIPDLAKPKIVIESLNAGSSWFTFNADGAGSAMKYNDRAPSCLKPA